MRDYPAAVFVRGMLRCPTCDGVVRPGHWKKNCCKAAYRKRKQNENRVLKTA